MGPALFFLSHAKERRNYAVSMSKDSRRLFGKDFERDFWGGKNEYIDKEMIVISGKKNLTKPYGERGWFHESQGSVQLHDKNKNDENLTFPKLHVCSVVKKL